MTTLFDDLKTGLEQAIDYEEGHGKAAVKTYTIHPVKEYSNVEIRDIRMNSGMTQKVFAAYLGVSVKTVEAWERGRIHPTGPAYRLLEFMSSNSLNDIDFIISE